MSNTLRTRKLEHAGKTLRAGRAVQTHHILHCEECGARIPAGKNVCRPCAVEAYHARRFELISLR